jgi:hypothetical protein
MAERSFAAMTDRGHADSDQVLSRQVRQDVPVDFGRGPQTEIGVELVGTNAGCLNVILAADV